MATDRLVAALNVDDRRPVDADAPEPVEVLKLAAVLPPVGNEIEHFFYIGDALLTDDPNNAAHDKYLLFSKVNTFQVKLFELKLFGVKILN